MSLFLHQNRYREIEHCITCSAVNGCQTADKSLAIIQVILPTPVHQLTSCEEKTVYNKHLHLEWPDCKFLAFFYFEL